MNKKTKAHAFDDEEKEILEAFESGRLRPVRSKTDYQAVAKNTLKKNRKISIKISGWDYNNIKLRAAQEGIPYQTLISSIIHKFLTGQLKST